MKLINASAEIWEQGNTLDDMWKHIARCTRVCYQSTPKENGETDEEFVKRVILRPDSSTGELNFDKIHGAMLEHGTVYLKFPYTDSIEEFKKCSKYFDNKYSIVLDLRRLSHNTEQGSVYVYDRYVTTNLRVIYENGWLDDLKYACAPTEHHAKRVTVSFTTNIGVSREFNRHRVNSIAEESTRYCNYSLGKFGSEVTFVKPAWFDNMTKEQQDSYKEMLAEAEENYLTLLDKWNNRKPDRRFKTGFKGNPLKPQQAREVLPLATKSHLIHTAFVDDWKHFFALRADGVSGPPHPNAALVAKPFKEEFIKRGYI